MASSFGSFDLTGRVIRDDGSLPFWEPNDPIIRAPLAYGAESIQDSGLRTMSMTLSLDLPNTSLYQSLRALSGTTATLVYYGTWLSVTMVITGSVRRYLDGSVRCTVQLTKSGWAL